MYDDTVTLLYNFLNQIYSPSPVPPFHSQLFPHLCFVLPSFPSTPITICSFFLSHASANDPFSHHSLSHDGGGFGKLVGLRPRIVVVGCGWCWICFFSLLFFPGGGEFDECGCGWIGSWVMALPVMGFANHAQYHFANHALVSFKKSLSIPRPIDYANNRQLDTTFCPLDSHKFCPLHIPFFSQSLYFIPLSRILYFISYNTIFSLFASKASKQNIHKALWEGKESRREKPEGCQHCQANTHLQSASHHRNTAVTTSVNVFSYAQKIWYGLFSFGLGI